MEITKLPIAFLSLWGLILLLGCGLDQDVTFERIEEVKFKSVSLTGSVTLVGDAWFHNPKPVGLKVSYIRAEVFADERSVARIREGLSIAVPAKESFKVPLEFDIPAKLLFEDRKNILQMLSEDMEVKLRVDGKLGIDLGGQEIGVPFDYEEIKGIQL